MTLEELKEKRNFSLKAVFTLGISAVPMEFWFVDTNLIRGTSLDRGAMGFILRIALFLVLTIPFMLIFFIVNLFKLIYYQIEINRQEKKGKEEE
jgi:uncharacterized membrane protein YhdT